MRKLFVLLSIFFLLSVIGCSTSSATTTPSGPPPTTIYFTNGAWTTVTGTLDNSNTTTTQGITQTTSNNSIITSITHTTISTQSTLVKPIIIDENGFRIYEKTQPPYSTTLNSPVDLINNTSAVNPTWSQLITFIESDPTDTDPYIDNFFVCSKFAETLHNNAEVAGIMTAWVYVGLSNYENGHACNAFMTTDKGLVFVDCTGSRLLTINPGQSKADYDKIAYISIGKDYGMISIGVASSPTYSSYTQYMRTCKDYLTELENYNLERQRYISELGGRTQLPEPEYSYFKSWYDKLNAEKARLDEMLSAIGKWTWQSLGIVTEVKIFW